MIICVVPHGEEWIIEFFQIQGKLDEIDGISWSFETGTYLYT